MQRTAWVAGLVGVVLASTVSAQRVNRDYTKAESRAERKCKDCDPVQLDALREHIKKERARGLELPALLKDARAWCKEQGLVESSYTHCLAALGRLACTDQYLPDVPRPPTEQEIAKQLAELPTVIQELVRESERQRLLAIASKERSLDRLQKEESRKKSKKTGSAFGPGRPLKHTIQQRTASVQKEIEELSRRDTFYVPLASITKLSVGSIGRLHYDAANSPHFPSAEVLQIIDARNMLVQTRWSVGSSWKTMWLRDVPTTGIVTGNRVSFPKLIHVAETRTYDTVLGGTKTVFVVEPIELAPHMEAVLRIIQSGRQLANALIQP